MKLRKEYPRENYMNVVGARAEIILRKRGLVVNFDHMEVLHKGLFIWRKVVPGRRVTLHTEPSFVVCLYEKRCTRL